MGPKLTILHHFTIVPSDIVGERAGILITVPGVDPPAMSGCVSESEDEPDGDEDEGKEESTSAAVEGHNQHFYQNNLSHLPKETINYEGCVSFHE